MDTIKFDEQEFAEILEKIIRLRDLMDRTAVSMTKSRRMLSAETDKFDEITGRFCQKIEKVHKSLDQLQYQGSQIIRVYRDTETSNIKMVEKLENSTDAKIITGVASGRMIYVKPHVIAVHSNYVNPEIHHEEWLVRATELTPSNIGWHTGPCVRPNIPSWRIFRRGGDR